MSKNDLAFNPTMCNYMKKLNYNKETKRLNWQATKHKPENILKDIATSNYKSKY